MTRLLTRSALHALLDIRAHQTHIGHLTCAFIRTTTARGVEQALMLAALSENATVEPHTGEASDQITTTTATAAEPITWRQPSLSSVTVEEAAVRVCRGEVPCLTTGGRRFGGAAQSAEEIGAGFQQLASAGTRLDLARFR